MSKRYNYEVDGDEYHKKRHSEIFGNKSLIDSWSAYAVHAYFRDLRPSETVLEIGAGTGINVAQLKHLVNRVVVVEPSQYAREHCRQLGLEAYRSLEELPAGVRYDRVLLRHVLEHVIDPPKLLAEIAELLKADGQLILVLPIESGFAEICKNDINHHLYSWNLQTISNLLTSTGYECKSAEINYFNGRRIFYWIFRIFGVQAYSAALSALGRLRRSGELLVVAKSH